MRVKPFEKLSRNDKAFFNSFKTKLEKMTENERLYGPMSGFCEEIEIKFVQETFDKSFQNPVMKYLNNSS